MLLHIETTAKYDVIIHKNIALYVFHVVLNIWIKISVKKKKNFSEKKNFWK